MQALPVWAQTALPADLNLSSTQKSVVVAPGTPNVVIRVAGHPEQAPAPINSGTAIGAGGSATTAGNGENGANGTAESIGTISLNDQDKDDDDAIETVGQVKLVYADIVVDSEEDQ